MEISIGIVVDNNKPIDIDEVYDFLAMKVEEERKKAKMIDYESIQKTIIDNNLDSYEITNLEVPIKEKGDTIFMPCPMCNAKGFTLRQNIKTKKYYCSNCKKTGDVEFIYDKKDPSKIIYAQFIDKGDEN